MLAYADLRTVATSDGVCLRFDRSEYDERMDRLELGYGPDRPMAARLTPEGHIVHVDPTTNEVCGLVLTQVRFRLEYEGCVEATLGPGRQVRLDARRVAELMSASGARVSRRFRRPATAPFR